MATAADPFDLQRFVDAQAPVYDQVCAELGAGRKTSHWMWFVFPQLQALGRSSTARHFGIAALDEAVAYAQHPLLGERLRHCSALVLAVRGRTALQIMGSPDDMKLRSSMTLFERAAPGDAVYGRVLDARHGGVRDPLTLALL